MKIALVHNSYQQPGGEDRVFQQERELLQSRGHEVIAYQRSNLELLDYPAYRRLLLAKTVVWARDAQREVLELLRREKPDVVHVHNTFTQISPSIFAACQEAGVPAVQTLHNFRLMCPAANFFRDGKICEECRESSLWRSVQHACYRQSTLATATVAVMLSVNRKHRTWIDGVNRFIALTEFARRKFIQGGLPVEKITVKPNFVDPDPGKKLGGGEGAVYVGRLSPEKGVKTLLQAWKRLRTPVSLRILGEGPLRGEMERLTATMNLARVTFLGHVDREKAQAEIKKARLLIFPSECYENFPLAIIEALSCGTPVICSRHGSMQEIVAEGETGLEFAPGNPDELAERVEWALEHPHQIEEMGKAARYEYEKKYTAESNYSALLEVYRQAASTN